MNAFVPHAGLPLSCCISDYPDGIILPIDKPYRWTSADVIRKMKWAACRHFGDKKLKVGHAGTLDPLATGILLVCIGKATRMAEELQKSPKQYVAGVSFGATTPSYDLEKDIDRSFSLDGVDENSIRQVLPSFVGEQLQVAPLFSAKSVDGVRAYEMARKLLKQGKAPEDENILQSSLINIYGLRLLNCGIQLPPAPVAEEGSRDSKINVADVSGHSLFSTEILVDCSKGTYIRALARDLGEALGTGAFLHSLRRTKNGPFDISDSLTMEEAVKIFSI